MCFFAKLCGFRPRHNSDLALWPCCVFLPGVGVVLIVLRHCIVSARAGGDVQWRQWRGKGVGSAASYQQKTEEDARKLFHLGQKCVRQAHVAAAGTRPLFAACLSHHTFDRMRSVQACTRIACAAWRVGACFLRRASPSPSPSCHHANARADASAAAASKAAGAGGSQDVAAAMAAAVAAVQAEVCCRHVVVMLCRGLVVCSRRSLLALTLGRAVVAC